MNLQRFICLVLLLSLSHHLISQTSEIPYIHFTHIENPTKSASIQINEIYRDSKGFMWFGTQSGLFRYNGYSFTEYADNLHDTASLINSFILSMKESPQGELLVGTMGGLSIYSYESDNFINFTHNPEDLSGIPANNINDIIVDSHNQIWLATENGLCRYISTNRNFIRYYPKVNSKLHKGGNALVCGVEGKKENLWIGTWGGGLLQFNRNTELFTRHLHEPGNNNSPSDNIIQSIALSDENILWLGCQNTGLSSLNLNNWTFTHYKPEKANVHGISENGVIEAYIDRKNQLWVSIRGDLGLYDRNKNRFIHYKHNPLDPESLSFGTISDIYDDIKGNLWVGSSIIDMHSPFKDKFTKFYHPPENDNFQDYSKVITADSQNDIWIGTFGNGVKIYKNNNFNSFRRIETNKTKEKSIINNRISALLEDRKGNMWVGTVKGLSLFNAKTHAFIEHFEKNDELFHPNIYHLFQDSRGIIWICTQEGINTFNPENKNLETIEYKIDGYNFKVSSILEENDSIFWIGTWNGLVRHNYSTGEFSFYYRDKGKKGSLSNDRINHIFRDSENKIWFATKTGLSLYVHESDSFIVYGKRNGFEDINIHHIFEDGNKCLWLLASSTLIKFNPKTNEVRNYSAENGARFNSNAFKYQKSGEFFIGGTHSGFYIFHPDSIKDNPFIPSVYIINFEIFNKPVDIGEESPLGEHISVTDTIILSYKQSVFSFEFAALNYVLPGQNQYAYKMEGFNEDWNFTNADIRLATYTNLDPGEYTFHVKASNNDGIWNKDGRSLKVIITPPWWQTWWFRISLITFIVGSALGFYFWRVNALKARQRELENKVAERTAELKEANVVLEEKQEEILQQNDEIVSVNEQLKSRNEEILTINTQIESQKQEIETAYKNTKILSDFGQKLTSTLDFDKINDMIYNYVSSLMDTSAFGIGIYNPKRKIIDFPYFMENGKPIPYFYKDVNNDKSLSAKCFNNKEEIVLNELREDYKNYLSVLPEVNEMRVPESVMHLPLIVEDRAIGVITVNSYQKNAYSEQDRMNLRTLAAYISIALENSRSYRTVRSQNEQINGSIRYAKTIQQAVLPAKAHLDKYHDNAIVFRPKDIVSGDFYWFTTINYGRASLLAVVDCTGHGVPGAFMSLIGNMALNDIINMKHIYEPSQILEELDQLIIKMLRQEKTDNHDGMDIALIKIEQDVNENSNQLSSEKPKTNIFFSGAKRPLYWYKAAEQTIEVVNGTRRSIGGVLTSANKKQSFQTVKLEVRPGDCLYLSSDGLADQCNSRKKKFSGKRLLKILGGNATLPMNQQKDILEKHLDEFQGDFPQRDDITLWGLKF